MTSREDLPLGYKLLTAGTAACVADLVTFPLDTSKVRLQIQGEQAAKATTKGSTQYRGLLHTIITIIRNEGVRSLYNGLPAGLQRQMCFASVRLGLYDPVKGFYQSIFDSTGLTKSDGEVSFVCRFLAGLTTGGVAVVVAQPTDVVKIRFQAQIRGAGTTQRYRSSFEAYRTIARDEGFKGLWRGWLPNVFRNSIVNVAEVVCYDIVKEFILGRRLMKDGIPCHFTSAVAAGFCTTVVSSPVDVVKTRYMNAPKGEYTGAIDCTVRMLTKEGFLAFYKGFTPSFARLVSWNIVLWLTWEQLRILVHKFRKDNS